MERKVICVINAILLCSLLSGLVACGNDAVDEDVDEEKDRAMKVIDSWICQQAEDDEMDVLTFSVDGVMVRSVLKQIDDVYLRCDMSEVDCSHDGYHVKYIVNGDTISKLWSVQEDVLSFDGRQYSRMGEEWKSRFAQATLTTTEGIKYDKNGTLATCGDEIYGNWTAHGYVLSFFADGRVHLTVSAGKYKDVFLGTFMSSSINELVFYAKQELQEDYTWSDELPVQGSGICRMDKGDLIVSLQIGNDMFDATYQKMF